MKSPPSTVLELLQRIREKPGMYIGRSSVRDLWVFLMGYHLGRHEAALPYDASFLRKFDEWVHERFRIKSSQSWAGVVEFYSVSEQGAWDLLWKLFDEYLEQVEVKVVQGPDEVVNEGQPRPVGTAERHARRKE